MCVGVSPHLNSSPATARCLAIEVRSDTTWRECQIPGLRAQSHKTVSVSPCTPPTSIPSPCCHLCFWTIGCKSEVPVTLPWGWINLLEQRTELRKTVYLLDNQFIKQGCKSGTSRWKGCVGHGGWERREAFTLLLETPPFLQSLTHSFISWAHGFFFSL